MFSAYPTVLLGASRTFKEEGLSRKKSGIGGFSYYWDPGSLWFFLLLGYHEVRKLSLPHRFQHDALSSHRLSTIEPVTLPSHRQNTIELDTLPFDHLNGMEGDTSLPID